MKVHFFFSFLRFSLIVALVPIFLCACGKKGDPIPLPCDSENPCEGELYPGTYPPKHQ